MTTLRPFVIQLSCWVEGSVDEAKTNPPGTQGGKEREKRGVRGRVFPYNSFDSKWWITRAKVKS